MEASDPHAHHERRLVARRQTAARLDAVDRRLSRARLSTFVAAGLLAAGAFWQGWFSGWWLGVPAVAFVVLIVIHDRIIQTRVVATRAVQWYERGLARIEDRWPGDGSRGTRFRDDNHPYECDLDIFGDGSVFQLLTTAQTAAGEETLAAWLLGGADPDTVRSRQAAVRDLAARPQLREDLHTLGAEVRGGVDSKSLVAWATAPPILNHSWLRVIGLVLAVAAATSITAWAAGMTPGVVPLLVLLINATFGITVRRRVDRVLHGSSAPARELVILSTVLGRLREEAFAADRLQHLQATLGDGRDEPVAAAHRLNRFIEMHDWQHNIIFAPFAVVMLWGLQCAAAVEAWRGRHGRSVAGWLQTVGEFEALASLATYSFEHPADPFPELVEGSPTPVFEAEQLAHPLIPRARVVTNDIRLGAEPQMLVVSGSNMSGKTTLLRTVGVNGVLALAGAPVRARQLRLSPVAIGATLRVQDSLLGGRSSFYAEITRIRQLVDIVRGSTPLLFLLDELFHGTNSNDRVEGAHGVLHFLVNLRAIGLVTTHDLALAGLADRLDATAANVHFEERFADGEMSFDYRCRPGRATHGNALALMRAVGLDVSVPNDPQS
jgi:hypothetical protein